jgi:hypothetical protein
MVGRYRNVSAEKLAHLLKQPIANRVYCSNLTNLSRESFVHHIRIRYLTPVTNEEKSEQNKMTSRPVSYLRLPKVLLIMGAIMLPFELVFNISLPIFKISNIRLSPCVIFMGTVLYFTRKRLSSGQSDKMFASQFEVKATRILIILGVFVTLLFIAATVHLFFASFRGGSDYYRPQ